MRRKNLNLGTFVMMLVMVLLVTTVMGCGVSKEPIPEEVIVEVTSDGETQTFILGTSKEDAPTIYTSFACDVKIISKVSKIDQIYQNGFSNGESLLLMEEEISCVPLGKKRNEVTYDTHVIASKSWPVRVILENGETYYFALQLDPEILEERQKK